MLLWTILILVGATLAGGSFGVVLDSLDGGWYPEDNGAPFGAGLTLGLGIGLVVVGIMVAWTRRS